MSSHTYHEIFLHLNWHTRADLPLLTGNLEEAAYLAIREKCRRMKGVQLNGVGGTETHVHLAVSIEPFVTVSEVVQGIKGASAHEVNQQFNRKAIQWQRGYGVVSFGRNNLEWVLDYIKHQKEHHATGKIQPRLETADSVEDQAEKPG